MLLLRTLLLCAWLLQGGATQLYVFTGYCDGRSPYKDIYNPGADYGSWEKAVFGKNFGCTVLDGAVKCWPTNAYVPPNLQLADAVDDLAVGAGRACALKNNVVTECWTSNQAVSTVPDGVPPDNTAVDQLILSESHSCALISGGVQCWGMSTLTTAQSTSRLTVPTFANPIVQITATPTGTCALDNANNVECWGDNGVFGYGSNPPPTPSPMVSFVVNDDSNIFCGELQDGSYYCWGSASWTPTYADLTGMGSVTTGGWATCGSVTEDGQATCWYGHSGDATTYTNMVGKRIHVQEAVCTYTEMTTVTTEAPTTSTTSTTITTSATVTTETTTATSTVSSTTSRTSTVTATTTSSSTITTTSSSTSSVTSTSSSTSSVSSTSSSTSTSSSSTTSTSTTSATTSTTSSSSSSSSSTSTTSSTSTSTSSTTSTSSSSTSTTSTTTTSTTSTTSSTSTSTTTHPGPPGDVVDTVDELLDYYATLEQQMTEELWHKTPEFNETVLRGNGSTVKVFLLPENGARNITLSVESLGASVVLPPAVLAPQRAAVLTVSNEEALEVLAGSEAFRRDTAGYPVTVKTGINLHIHNGTGAVRITGLDPPIILRMPPFNDSDKAICAYWNVERQSWAFDGVTTRYNKTDNVLECLTTHLSFFAAIIRGILAALMCSQLTLLNPDALRELVKLDWLATPLGAIFMALLAAYGMLFALAAFLDRKRNVTWSDECFLYPTTAEAPPRASETEATALKPRCGCVDPGEVGSMLKDICDEMISEMLEAFGAIRLLCETACEAMGSGDGQSGGQNKFQRVAQKAAGSFLQGAVCRKVSVQLGVHIDVVNFVVDDEDFKEALKAGVVDGECPCHSNWHELNALVAKSLDDAWNEVGSWKAMTLLCGRIFGMEFPFMPLFNVNPFMTSCQRVLIFTGELSGTFLLAVIFFQASGDMKGKVQEDPDACEAGDIWEKIGMLIVIGTASAIFALIPANILNRLHNRSITKFDYPNCPEWKRQLQTWRRKDRLLWLVGLLYMGFCLFMVALFLANVHPDDGVEWLVSDLVSMAEDWIVMPLLVAISLPFLTAISLQGASCLAGVHRREVIERKRSGLQEAEKEIEEAEKQEDSNKEGEQNEVEQNSNMVSV